MNHAAEVEKLIWNILDEYAKENEVKMTCNSYHDGDYETGTIKIKIYGK